MRTVAIVGNGNMNSFDGIASEIDSFDEVIRMNAGGLPETISEIHHKVGQKMTGFAWQAYKEDRWDNLKKIKETYPECIVHDRFDISAVRAYFDFAKQETLTDRKWLSNMRKYQRTSKNYIERYLQMKFVRYSFDIDWKPLFDKWGEFFPTTGLSTIFYHIQRDYIPHIYCFSQEPHTPHHFGENPRGLTNSHDLVLEQKIVASWVKDGLIVHRK